MFTKTGICCLGVSLAERYTFQTQWGEFQARISGQNFRAEAGEFQTHVRGVSDAHNGAHFRRIMESLFKIWNLGFGLRV